jgi:hypothetical protein
MSKLWRELVWVYVLCLCVSCAGSQAKTVRPAAPKPPTQPASWVPADATTVGRIGLDALRGTALWPLWIELGGEQRLSSWVALDKVKRVTFGGTGQTRDELSYVAALEGDFARDELQQLAQRDHVNAEQHGILQVYRRPDGYWTQISDKLIVTCTVDRIEALAARATAGDGIPFQRTPLYTSLAERVAHDQAHVSLLAEDPEGKGRARLEQRISRYGLGAFAREAQRLGVSLEIGADYRLTAVAETADEARGQLVQQELKQTLESISNNLFVRMLGISPILAQVRVSQSGNYVFVRGNVAEVDVNTAISRVHSALSLADGAGPLSGEP